MYWLAAATFVVGLAFGSFANVVIYRFPKGLSIVKPRSACPSCGVEIAWYDNLPVVSYLVLRGRCRNCRNPISPRYLVVELVTGCLWGAMTLRLGFDWALPAFLTLATVLVILSAIDIESRRIPNRIVLIGAAASSVWLLITALVTGQWVRLGVAVLGGLAFGGVLFLIALVYPKGMGGGDIKLSAYLGLHLGWLSLGHVFVGGFVGFLTGSLVGILLMLLSGKGRKDPIPFGPSLSAGALISIFFGEALLSVWLG